MLSYLNAVLCLIGVFMCACRLGTRMSRDKTKGVIRFQYVMWMNVDLCLLLAFPHDWTHIVMSGSILAYLISTSPQWRYGAPLHSLKHKVYDGNFSSGD